MSKLSNCPFCNGNAELVSKTDRVGYGEYMTFHDQFFVVCKTCGASAEAFIKLPLSDMTKYTVKDFRGNPTLRAQVEDEYIIYCEELEQQAIDAWNRRLL